MISRKHTTEPLKDTPHNVEVKQLYNDESAQIMHITLKPGEALKPHRTPVDVVFYVLEGITTVHIGDEKQQFDANTLIESPAKVVHLLSNEGDCDTRILVIKAPRPVSKTAVL